MELKISNSCNSEVLRDEFHYDPLSLSLNKKEKKKKKKKKMGVGGGGE